MVSAVVPSLRECPVHQIPRNGKISMFQRGHVWSWKICLAALQVVFKNVCYFSPFNVDILKIWHFSGQQLLFLTFKWYFAKPNAVSGCHVRVDFGMSWMILKVSYGSPLLWRFPLQWSYQKSWMVYFMESPIYKWMTTGGTPILGNPHIVLAGFLWTRLFKFILNNPTIYYIITVLV